LQPTPVIPIVTCMPSGENEVECTFTPAQACVNRRGEDRDDERWDVIVAARARPSETTSAPMPITNASQAIADSVSELLATSRNAAASALATHEVKRTRMMMLVIWCC
jgi:hypothetical protein